MTTLREHGVDFEHWCFACGRQNPAGLHLELEAHGDRISARHTVTRAHQSYDGTVHGGIITALLDEVMGWAVFLRGGWGVTAKLTVAFRAPVALDEPLVATGWIERDRGRGIETRGRLERASDGALLAEAEALFLRMPEDQRAALERRYGAEPGVLARVRAAIEAEQETTDERRGRGSGGGAPAGAEHAEGRVLEQEEKARA